MLIEIQPLMILNFRKMKELKILNLISFIFFYGAFAFAQDNNNTPIENVKLYKIPLTNTVVSTYEKLLLFKVSEYDFGKNSNGIAIQPQLLNENINKIFNTVVLANSDVASNGSAIGYQKNDSKETVSVNSISKISASYSHFLKVGIHAKGSSSPFNLYDDNTWSSGVGATLGYIYKRQNSSTSYIDNEAEKVSLKRLKFVDSLIKIKISYAKKLESIESLISELDKSKATYYHKKDSLNAIKNEIETFNSVFKNVNPNFTLTDYYNKLLYNPDVLPDTVFILENQRALNELEKSGSTAFNKAIDYIIEELTAFDKKHDITYGYSLHWFDGDFTLTNATYKFEEANIDNTLYVALNDSLKFDKSQNKLKLSTQINYNFTKKSRRNLMFFKAGTALHSGSFLSSNLLNGTPKIDENQNVIDESNSEENTLKGDFNAIDKTLTYGSFSAYGAMFFGSNQKFGINLNLSHNYLINKPENVFYKNNFTALVGPIFKATGKEGKGVVLGIDIGFDNAIYNTKINNDFTARLRVGIPFEIYTKSK